MNRKTKYLIPAFVAVFALMSVVATPYVMAELNSEYGAKMHKSFMAVEVQGFSGSIPIPEDMSRTSHSELKEQVTVTLLEAVTVANESGFSDAKAAHIGIVKDENGSKYVAWIIASMDLPKEFGPITANIFVVDAGDVTITATTTKEIDLFAMKDKMFGAGGDYAQKSEKMMQKFSEQTGDADVDAARATFVEKLQELKAALESGDSESASELRDELKDLRSELGNIRSYGR